MKAKRGTWAALSGILVACVVAGSLLVATAASARTDAGAVPAAPTGGKIRIGEVFFQVDPFQVALEQHAKRWASRMNIELIACNQKGSAEVGINCVNDWIAQRVDGIIYAPLDPAAAVRPVQSAQAAGIPIISVVIKPNAPARMPFVAVNERKLTFKAGQQAARQARRFFPGQQLGVLALDLLNLPICKRDRMGGFIAGVKSVQRNARIYDIGAKGDRLDATNKTADFIQSGRPFNIVTACTGEMIQGALAALKSADRGKAVGKRPTTEYVFAIDGDKVQLQQLLDRTSPVMQSMGLTPREQARRQLLLVMELVRKRIPLTSSKTVIAGAQLVSPNCKAVNTYLTTQYLTRALPCR